jgi:hypothetical protein
MRKRAGWVTGIALAVALALAGAAVAAAPRPPGAPSPAAARRAPRKIKLTELDKRVAKLVTALFLAYERRSVEGVMEHVSSSFRTRDTFGFGSSPGSFSSSLIADYQNLRNIQYSVDVEPPQYSPDYRSARVEVRWNRRARFAVSGEEWIVRDQRSLLLFELRPDRVRLGAIEGDPAIALSNPAGVLVVDRGTVDGRVVDAAESVTFGRRGEGERDLTAFGNLRRVPPAGAGGGGGGGLPDLVSTISRVIDDPPSASGFSVEVQVRNLGTQLTGPSTLEVDIDSPAVSRTAAVPSLAAGASTVVLLSFDPPGALPPAGPRTITSIADSARVVTESNEANNNNSILKVFTP